MRTKSDIWADMAAASATSASTDHSRALSGAEWLQQLAAELVAVIKAEAVQQEPQDESPGEGWRWLEPGELIEDHDMVKGASKFFPNMAAVVGCKVAPGQYRCYRRRI